MLGERAASRPLRLTGQRQRIRLEHHHAGLLLARVRRELLRRTVEDELDVLGVGHQDAVRGGDPHVERAGAVLAHQATNGVEPAAVDIEQIRDADWALFSAEQPGDGVGGGCGRRELDAFQC